MPRLGSRDLLQLALVSDPRVAPGGKSIAVVVTRIERKEGEDEGGSEPPRYLSQVHLYDTSGRTKVVDEGAYSDTRPRFSRDARHLAFLRRAGKEEAAQLFMMKLGANKPRQLTEEPGGVETFEWHPGSDTLAYLAGAQAREQQVPTLREIDRLRYKFDGKGYLPAAPRKLCLVEAGGEARELDTGGLDFEELAWEAEGSHLLLSGAQDQAERDEDLRRLWRLDSSGGAPKLLTAARRLSALSPGPGGKIAFLAPAHPEQPSGPSAVWLVTAEGGEERRLTAEDLDLSPATGGDCRYGDYPNRPLWLAGDSLFVNHNRAGRSGIARLNPARGELVALDDQEAVVTAFDHADGTLAFIRESSSHPGELFVKTAQEAPRQLTTLNHELAERAGFSAAKGPFSVDREAGASYWRLDPAERRDDLALVVQVHGGPHTNVGQGFYFEYQLLAARGYTVIYGNPHGSSSYGQAFATAVLGSYGTIDADDVLAFVDHALATHPDPQAPVHLTGGSYGGFMTNWLVAHSDRFRSAVTQRSICNFVSFYGTSDIGYWFSERELGGNPWDDFERLWQQSPLRLAHRIATPLLILHSESDLRCPVEQAQQLFVAVKRSGIAETRLVLFPDENHELSRSGRPARRVERLDAIVGWFEDHP
ncbi:MAG: S9 family peptidase [Trueperaceae bacterium]